MAARYSPGHRRPQRLMMLGALPSASLFDGLSECALPEGWRWRRDGPLTLVPPAVLALAPLTLDFGAGRLAHRLLRASEEPLVRALGLRRKDGPRRVVDMTGGLAGDASRMAAAGAQVLLIERHPAVLALVVDALRRAEAEGLAPWGDRLRLSLGNACEALPEGFDAAYLDPMYPPRKKAALGAQDLRVLDALFSASEGGERAEASTPEALLAAARRGTFRRIVMKGPASYAPPPPAPDFVHRGKAVNFYGWLSSANSA